MSDIGKAYVQIIPKAPGISGKISNLIGPGSKEAGDKAGLSIGSGIKKAIVAAGIGSAVVGVVKGAVTEGGKLQQSYGGLETIYGKAAEQAKQFAKEASRAGISANDYSEQAVSFGASLKQAYGGDTTKAVKAANTAILDMTDNAAKMGTPIENIQNAYQGFAKQNYTMLDNLKLGYGGTKTEMERLLADAEKLSGQKYDISNLGDVYDAIHVIQQDLGLTGVAAKEASETFTGSFEAMKAAGQNLLGALALGEDVGPMMSEFASSLSTFLFDNLIPMIGTVLQSLPEAIGTFISTGAPKLMESAKSLVEAIKNGIITYLPMVLEAIPQFVMSIGETLAGSGSGLLSKVGELIQGVAGVIEPILTKIPEWYSTYIAPAMSAILSVVVPVFDTIKNAVVTALSDIYGIFQEIMPQLLEVVQTVWPSIKSIIQTVMNILKAVVPPVWNVIKSIVTTVMKAVLSVVQAVWPKVSSIVKTAVNAIKTVINGISSVVSKVKSTFEKVFNAIKAPIDKAREFVKNAVDKIKSFFPFHVGKIFDAIKLPHISVSGGKAPFGIGGKGSLPKFSVTWAAQGGIVDGATLIGAGEAGAEAIVPLDPFWKRMDTLADKMRANDGNITVNLNYNASDDANVMLRDLARGIKRYRRAGAF